MKSQDWRSGLQLWLTRSRETPGAVQREVLQMLSMGDRSFRDLHKESVYWQSQVACAIARQMKIGRIIRVDEGRYRRVS